MAQVPALSGNDVQAIRAVEKSLRTAYDQTSAKVADPSVTLVCEDGQTTVFVRCGNLFRELYVNGVVDLRTKDQGSLPRA